MYSENLLVLKICQVNNFNVISAFIFFFNFFFSNFYFGGIAVSLISFRGLAE